MRRSLILLAFSVLAACGRHNHVANVASTDIWPMFQRAPDHNAVLANQDLIARWSLPAGAQVNGGFALAGTTLFADTFGKELLAIDARSGKVLWRAGADDVLMSTPVLGDGIVYVGSGTNARLPSPQISRDPLHSGNLVWGRKEGNALYAFDARTGAQRWAFKTVGEDMPSPAIAGKTLVFANGDFHAYGVDAATGKQLWQRALIGPATMASATLAEGLAYVSVCDYTWPYRCRTYALDPSSGAQRWSAPFGNSDASPAYGGGLLFVSNVENAESEWQNRKAGRTVVTALDAKSGRARWTYRSSRVGPYTEVGSSERAIAGTYANGVYYQPVPTSDELIAFDARSGAVRWRFTSIAPIKMSPVIYRGKLYAGDTSGILYDLDASSGRVIKEVSFKEPFSVAPPLIVGNTMFIADGQTIYAIALLS